MMTLLIKHKLLHVLVPEETWTATSGLCCLYAMYVSIKWSKKEKKEVL